MNIRELVRGHGLGAQLLRGGIGSAFVQVLYRLLALALGIVLARALGAVGYGVYAYAFAIMSLLRVGAEAGVPMLLMREVAAAEAQGDWAMLMGALVRGKQLVLIGSGLSVVGGLTVLCIVAGHMSRAVLYTTALMLLVIPPVTLTKTLAFGARGLHSVVTGQVVDLLLRPALVLLVAGSIFAVFPYLRTPEYAMAAQFGAALVALAVSARVLNRLLPSETSATVARYRAWRWMKNSLPFILIGGAGVINSQTDIIMLGWFRSAAEVGAYRVAAQGAVLVAFFVNAAGSALAPSFAKVYSTEGLARLRRLYRNTTIVVIVLSLPVALVFTLFGERLITFVFGHEYAPAALPLSILAVGYMLNAVFGPVGTLLAMVGRERIAAKLLSLSALLNVILNLALIPPYGVEGGAIATAFTIASYHAVLRYVVRRDLGF